MDRAKKNTKRIFKTSPEQLEKNRQRLRARHKHLDKTLPGSRIEDNPDFDAILKAIENEDSR